jgi:hypothetical protein
MNVMTLCKFGSWPETVEVINVGTPSSSGSNRVQSMCLSPRQHAGDAIAVAMRRVTIAGLTPCYVALDAHISGHSAVDEHSVGIAYERVELCFSQTTLERAQWKD